METINKIFEKLKETLNCTLINVDLLSHLYNLPAAENSRRVITVSPPT